MISGQNGNVKESTPLGSGFPLLTTQYFPACHEAKAKWVMKPIYNSRVLKSGRMWCGFVGSRTTDGRGGGKYVSDI